MFYSSEAKSKYPENPAMKNDWVARAQRAAYDQGRIHALRILRSRANLSGVLGDPTYWFPIRDAVDAEIYRVEREVGK